MKNNNLKAVAEKMLGRDFSDVKIIECDGVFAEIKDGKRVIGGANAPQKLRAFSILALNEGKPEFSVKQCPKFKQLGAMIDMSRGGVMRVEKVKEYINRLAMFGANELLLYTEDIYTLEEYPHFGYCRGAYTDEELREIDDYAYSLDVEVIPCIQTLGHMGQYLSWGHETTEIRDTAGVLLCDSEQTFKFIETEIAKMRKVFRSRQIHIGMDEANDVGLGKYLKEKGYVDRYDLLKRHLGKVVEICKKYDFSPMMWSDMFFRLSSPTDEYYIYDWDFHFEEKMVTDVPDAQLVYWDYYNASEGCYRNMMRLHHEIGKPIVFAGGIWTWTGFLPDYLKTEKTMLPALKVCREENIENVFATMWGDNGCETDYFRALYSFGIFSEYCYCEEEPTKEQIDAIGALISGNNKAYIDTIARFHSEKYGKYLIWGDIFYNLTGVDFSETQHSNIYSNLAESPEISDDEFAVLAFKIAGLKAKVYADLQRDYKTNNNLSVYVNDIFPELVKCYKRLYTLHKENWHCVNKTFGFEDIEARYGATILRLESATEAVNKYIDGKTKNIEELEYTPVYGEDRGYYYSKMAFAKV